MLKWLVPVLLLAAKSCVFVGGLLYGVFTVGVPTHDTSPAVAALEKRDMNTAECQCGVSDCPKAFSKQS